MGISVMGSSIVLKAKTQDRNFLRSPTTIAWLTQGSSFCKNVTRYETVGETGDNFGTGACREVSVHCVVKRRFYLQ